MVVGGCSPAGRVEPQRDVNCVLDCPSLLSLPSLNARTRILDHTQCHARISGHVVRALIGLWYEQGRAIKALTKASLLLACVVAWCLAAPCRVQWHSMAMLRLTAVTGVMQPLDYNDFTWLICPCMHADGCHISTGSLHQARAAHAPRAAACATDGSRQAYFGRCKSCKGGIK